MKSSSILRRQLQALRRKHLGTAVATGTAVAVAVGVELLALAMFVDWWLELPWGVRLISLAGQVTLLGYLLYRGVILPLCTPPDEDDLALMVEKARPEFHSRLISAVQLTRPGAIPEGAAASLVSALVEQTEAMARPLDFRAIVPTERLHKLGLLALSVSLLALGGFLYGRDVCGDLLRRALLSHVPVPRKTRVVVLEGNKTIGRGDDVRLEAYAQGVIPSEGKLELEYRNRRPQQFTLEQNPNNPIHFGRTIENVQDSFSYRVYLNDGTSAPYEVHAIPRPTVARIECRQVYPAYTGLAPVSRPLGDLTLLAGSQLHLQVSATKSLQRATLRLMGPDQTSPLLVDPDHPTNATGFLTVPAQGLSGFSIQLLDTEDMESRDAAVYRIDTLPDKPPKVLITYPERKEELVTRQATLLVGMHIEDDFKIGRVRLHYKIDTVQDGAEQNLELDLGETAPHQLQRAFPWRLESFQPPLLEGSQIEFWIEALDNNDTTGPSLGTSAHQLARVVSRDEKLADALNRASDYLSGIEDVAEDQARANRNLGDIILQKTRPSEP